MGALTLNFIVWEFFNRLGMLILRAHTRFRGGASHAVQAGTNMLQPVQQCHWNTRRQIDNNAVGGAERARLEEPHNIVQRRKLAGAQLHLASHYYQHRINGATTAWPSRRCMRVWWKPPRMV